MRGRIGNIGKRKLLQTVLAGAACLSLTAALFLMPGGLAQGAGTRLDWSKNNNNECSITINPGELDGIDEAGITVDLYKVADAVKKDGYDTYSYELSEGFKALKNALTGDSRVEFEALEKGLSEDNLPNLTNDDWMDLSQKAARIVLGYGEADVTTESKAPTVESIASVKIEAGQKSVKFDSIGFGLYLVIARDSAEDAAPASYSKVKVTEGENEENGTSSLVTMAYSDTEVYTFLPELISMPSTVLELSETVRDNNKNQTGTGEWQYDITAILKPEKEPLYGNLTIKKTLTSYKDGEPVAFVYQIDVYDKEGEDGELIDSGSVSIVFDAPGEKTYSVEGMKFPAGSYVVVTEVYSGPSYTAEDTVWSGIIPVGDGQTDTPAEVTASFINNYDGRIDGGGYIINRFTYKAGEDGKGSWNLVQISSDSDAIEGDTPGDSDERSEEETGEASDKGNQETEEETGENSAGGNQGNETGNP